MSRPSKEYQAFDTLMKKLLTVPKTTIVERHAAHRERRANHHSKPGPKPKKRASRDENDAS
jgi:hypothetical protein